MSKKHRCEQNALKKILNRDEEKKKPTSICDAWSEKVSLASCVPTLSNLQR